MNAEIKAATNPTRSVGANSAKPNAWDEFAIFNNSYAVAPPITGIAKKKENSVATALGNPKSIPPIMVAPEREVPGINAAHWASPTFRASSAVNWSMLSIFFMVDALV